MHQGDVLPHDLLNSELTDSFFKYTKIYSASLEEGNYSWLFSITQIIKLKVTARKISAKPHSNHPGRHVGFHRGYATTDYIHVFEQTVEHSVEFSKPLCIAFI